MIELEILTEGVPAGLAELMNQVSEVCCELEGVRRSQAYARIVDDEAMHELNRSTRGVDRTTDVLSFPSVRYPHGTAKDHPRLLRREVDPETGRAFLGDLVISLPRAREQACSYGHSLSRELGYLTAHAMFHLLGYDHMVEEEKAQMRAMEEQAMARVGLARREVMTDAELFARASECVKNAYAPYSGFKVGACLMDEEGNTYTGCNIENASYGGTICAERAAVARAVSDGARRFVTIAIAGEKCKAWPCGICRQVLSEFGKDMRVLVGQAGGEFEATTLSALLPNSFGPDDLK